MGRHFRNASWGGISAFFKGVYGLLHALLVVRLLGVEGYGQVVTFLSWFVLYLSLNSSIFTVVVVNLMKMIHDDDQNSRASTLSASVLFITISLAVLTLVTSVLYALTPGFNGVDTRVVVLLMGGLTALQIGVAFQSALVESAGRLDRAMKWQMIGPIVTLALLAFAFATKLTVTPSAYVAVLCVGALTDFFLVSLVRRNVMPLSWRMFVSHNKFRVMIGLLRSGGLLQGASLMNMFLEPLNKLLLNYFLGPSSVTLYDLAMKVIWGILNLFSSAMRVFLHIGSQNEEAVAPAFFKAITLAGVPMVILHIVGVLFLAMVGRFWLAVDTNQLMVFFAIASLSNLGMIFVTPLYISLIGRGDLLFIFRTQAILAATNIVVSLILIPGIGLVGAAFGLFSATVFNAIAILMRCRSQLDQFRGLGRAITGARTRYLLVLCLFAAAVLWGRGGQSYFVLAGIFLATGAIAVREPIMGFVIARMNSSSLK